MSSYTQHTKYSAGTHSNSGGSSSTESSLKGYSNKLRKSKILLFSLLYNVQLHISTAYPFLRNILYFLEMLQLISFPLEFAFTSFGNTHIDNGLYYFTRIRTVMPPVADSSAQTAVLSLAIIYLGLVLVVGARLAFILEEGDSTSPKWLKMWGLVTIGIHQIIYLPLLSMLFSVLHCGITSVRDHNVSLSGLHQTYADKYSDFADLRCRDDQSVTFIVLATILLGIAIVMFGIIAAAVPGFDQRRSTRFNLFGMTFTRIPLYLYLIKTCATIYIQFSGPITFNTRTGLFHWGLFFVFLFLLVHLLHYLPFYRRAANFIYSAFFTIGCWTALCAFAASRADERTDVFIVYIVLLVPLAVVSLLACFLRSRKYYNTTSWESGQARTFWKGFEVELYTRPYAHGPRDKDQTKLYQETVISIFWKGMQQFPTNVGVRVSLMQYLLEDKGNFQLLTSVAEKVKNPDVAIDMKFLLHCIEKHRISMALAMDGGAEEVSKNILRANTHANRAKLLIKSFWESLLHEEELMLLPTIVAKLEREETKADIIFKKLRMRFPNNAAVMRHYALFLEEVKSEPEIAYTLFKQADEAEQERATRHVFEHPVAHHPPPQQPEEAGEITMESDGKNKSKLKLDVTGSVELGTISKAKRRHAKKKQDRFEALRNESGEGPPSPRRDEAAEINMPTAKSDAGSVNPGYALSFASSMPDPRPMVKRMTKMELMRYRRYRSQAESSRSHSVWKMTYAINLTLLVLLINMVIVFGATMGVLSNQQSAVNQLFDVVTMRNDVALSVSSTLRATRVITTFDNATFRTDLAQMVNSTNDLEASTVEVFNTNEGYDAVVDGWSKTLYPAYIWSPLRTTNNGYIESETNALDLLSQYTFWMNQAVNVMLNPARGADTLWNATSGRFIFDNGLTGVYSALMHVVDLYQDKSESTIRILRSITIALLPLSFIILLLLVWFLLRAAIREIQQERIHILKLFLGIPKDNILSIVGLIRGGEGGEDEDELFAADEEEVSTFSTTIDLGEQDSHDSSVWILKNTRLSMLRNFFLKFLFSLFAVFILVLVASSIVLASVQDFNTTVNEVNLAGQRRTVASHLNSAALGVAYYAEISRNFPTFDVNTVIISPSEFRSFMQEDIDQLKEVNHRLTYGDDGHGGISTHEYLVDLMYNNQTCQPILNYTYACSGMNSLLVYVIALAEIILSIPDSQVAFNTSQLATMSDVIYLQLGPLFVEALGFYRQQADDVIDDVSTAVICIFVLIFPVLLAVNFLLRPMAIQIKQEHQRTLRMLLMIPLNVIDSTPAIKDYLEAMLRDAGRTAWYRGRSKGRRDNADKFLATHEPLLQAVVKGSDEALLVVSAEGTIEMLNPATEKLFGHEKRHILGHRISMIFTEPSTDEIIMRIRPRNIPLIPSASSSSAAPTPKQEDGGVIHEEMQLEGLTSNGRVFPASVTLSQFKVNSKVYYGVYVRDISYMRDIEIQMEKEREMLSTQQKKLQDLLLNVFPKSIAEQLLIKGDEYQPHLIAEEYKEATILFADIVGFTQMCSDLEPAVLLLILDGIFSEWDVLVEKYKLQKIKTIGDCFMAAGGVPDRMVDHVERVIDFAMEMIETLHRYNETCLLLKSRSLLLNLRIGINTGPVVAGIIGRSRICFDLWGDAVNVASRMESTSIVGRIQVSQTVFNRVKNRYEFEERGTIEVKGKGAMLTYLLVAPRFKRTNSGKVIDTRFANHLSGMPSLKSTEPFPPPPGAPPRGPSLGPTPSPTPPVTPSAGDPSYVINLATTSSTSSLRGPSPAPSPISGPSAGPNFGMPSPGSTSILRNPLGQASGREGGREGGVNFSRMPPTPTTTHQATPININAINSNTTTSATTTPRTPTTTPTTPTTTTSTTTTPRTPTTTPTTPTTTATTPPRTPTTTTTTDNNTTSPRTPPTTIATTDDNNTTNPPPPSPPRDNFSLDDKTIPPHIP